MKILIVEPHCDDAFLSLGWHIKKLWKDHDITILTVYGDKKRDAEAVEYARSVGAKSVCLSLPENKMLSEAKTKLIGPLTGILKVYAKDFILVYPIGIQHPDHRSVAYTCFKSETRRSKLVYLDCPYASKIKNTEEINQLTEGLPLYSIATPHSSKWNSIPVFKSQAKFFHFNDSLRTSKIPEIILQQNLSKSYQERT